MREWVLKNTDVLEEKYDNIINSNTININQEKKIITKKKYTNSYSHPFCKISWFTLGRPSKIRCAFFKIKFDGNYYIYKDVKFKILANSIPELEKILYSKKRKGTCLEYGIDICFNIENSKVVIAMCDNPWTKETDKFLHCFVTYQGKDGIEIVFDATLNIIMEKELYLKLFKANIISEIEREKMISDIEYIQANKISVTVSEYLCFPEEIVQGVKRYVKNK